MRTTKVQFTSFFTKLYAILKSSIKSYLKYEAKNTGVPQSVITRLLNRIDKLTAQSYEDKDCRRYVKRLRRERNQLFTFYSTTT